MKKVVFLLLAILLPFLLSLVCSPQIARLWEISPALSMLVFLCMLAFACVALDLCEGGLS